MNLLVSCSTGEESHQLELPSGSAAGALGGEVLSYEGEVLCTADVWHICRPPDAGSTHQSLQKSCPIFTSKDDLPDLWECDMELVVSSYSFELLGNRPTLLSGNPELQTLNKTKISKVGDSNHSTTLTYITHTLKNSLYNFYIKDIKLYLRGSLLHTLPRSNKQKDLFKLDKVICLT